MEQAVSPRDSIITRLTLLVGGTLIAAVLVIGGMALFEQQRQLSRAIKTKAETLAQFMAQVSPISVLSLNFVEMNNNVKKVVLTDDEAVYAIICNEQGVPLSFYLKEADPAVNGEARALWSEKSPLAAVWEIKRVARILEVEAPIMAGGKRIGSATVGFSFEHMRHALLVQIAFIGATLIAVTGACIFLLVLVLRRTLQPVQVLTSAATQISTGDLNVVLAGTNRRDEVGVLSRAFGSMAQQLRGLIAGMEQRLAELQDMGRALQAREKDLHQITLFQRTILDNVSYGIISTTPEGMVTSFNPAAEMLLGYTADEIVGKRTPECWHDADEILRHARQLSNELGETIQPGFEVFAARPRHNLSEEGEWTFICKDGRRVPVNLSVTALRDEENRLTGFVGLVYDITERKRAEQALRESRQRLDNIVANSPGAIYRCANDAEWTMEFLSAAITQITGYPAEDFLGNRAISYASIIHPDDRRLVEARVAEGVGRKTRFEIDYRLVARDGTLRWVHEQGQGVFDADGKLLCLDGFIFDMTALMAAEEEIRKLNQELELRVAERTAQLESANKELEAFAYSVSHDLRAPLRAIDGFSHILEEDYGGRLDAEGTRLLGVVRDNAARMAQLIDDILKFSRAGRLEFNADLIDMERMARAVLAELAPDADESRLHVEIDHLPSAHGDSAMMRQVFVNLLANAIKFSRNRQPAQIKVGCRAEENETIYFVQDNGAGFDMRYADKLFGVFQRLHGTNEFEGTGIGLAIVKRIVNRHGGRVWAESRINEGATFYFSLPAHHGSEK